MMIVDLYERSDKFYKKCKCARPCHLVNYAARISSSFYPDLNTAESLKEYHKDKTEQDYRY